MKKTNEFLIATMMSLAIMGALIVVTMNGCNKPSSTAPILPGNEFLTTTLVVISNTNGQPHDTLVWSETPSETVPDTVRSFVTLQENTTYNIQIIILDSTQNVDSASFVVSNEIISRENYHLFCFYDSTNQDDQYGAGTGSSRGSSGWANVTVDHPNNDNNKPPLPFGITDQLHTFGPTHGQCEVVLRHQPDVKNGDCAPGSTDLDVYYNITVK